MGAFVAISRAIDVTSNAYRIYDKVNKGECKKFSDVAQITLCVVNVSAVSLQVIVEHKGELIDKEKGIYKYREITNVQCGKVANVASFASASIGVLSDKEASALKKLAQISGIAMITLPGVANCSDKACKQYYALGRILQVGSEFFFDNSPTPPPEEVVIVPYGFDDWASQQMACQGKICPVSRLYMFKVMVSQQNRNLRVERRFLDGLRARGINTFDYQGRTYNIDRFDCDAQASQINVRFYNDHLYPFMREAMAELIRQEALREQALREQELRNQPN